MRFNLVALFFAISGTVVNAHELDVWDFAHSYKQECSAGTMKDMNECLAAAYENVELRMNGTYKRLLLSLKDPRPLAKAQTSWIKFREAQCSFEVPQEWTGSAVPYSRRSCLIDHTERRARDLERIIPCNGCVEFKPEHYK